MALLTEDEIHKIAAVEERQWWYRGTRDICFALLDPFIARRASMEILDVGCGTGGNLLRLNRYGRARGIDVEPLCVHYCRAKGLDVSLGSMEELGQPRASLDLLTMFDVLCRADPREAVGIVSGMADVLRPGGLIAFREPAMPSAHGWHDQAVNIRQRFTRGSVTALLHAAGFEPLRITYLNTLLFPPILLLRRLQRSRQPQFAKSDVDDTAEPINSLLFALLRIERTLLRATDLPFGVSLFAVARKR
jgi:SAM-dependent methyltransferase